MDILFLYFCRIYCVKRRNRMPLRRRDPEVAAKGFRSSKIQIPCRKTAKSAKNVPEEEKIEIRNKKFSSNDKIECEHQ